MNTGKERFSSTEKLKNVVAIGLASAALFSCTEPFGDQHHVSIVPLSSADTFRQSLVAVHTPDMLALENDWDAALTRHSGEVDIAVYDYASGQTAHTHYPKNADGATFDTASIVKLSTLENLLFQNQKNEQQLSEYKKDLAAKMIENSDNNATAILWGEVGDAPTMDNYWQHEIGTTATTAGTNGYWGNTQTTALDQLKVVNAIANAGTILSPLTTESGVYAKELLEHVEPDQRWGVSGGVPEDIPVNLKNGWFPDSFTTNDYSDTSSWTINSIGYIPNNYSIAILTRGNRTMEEGIRLTENLSSIAWKSMQDNVLAPNPPKQ